MLNTDRPKSPRPFGVWLSTAWLGLFAGVMPLSIATTGMWFGAIPIWQGIGVVVLCCAVIRAAYTTWRGSPLARNALVTLAALFYLGVAANNVWLAMGDDLPQGLAFRLWGRAIRSVITIMIIGTYLNQSKAARRFFGENIQAEKDSENQVVIPSDGINPQ